MLVFRRHNGRCSSARFEDFAPRIIAKDFNEAFQSELQAPEFVEGFLQAALEEGTETFLLALQDMAKANGGMAQMAEKTSLQRESRRNFLLRAVDIYAACCYTLG